MISKIQQKAFTLLEMLVVIGIIALILGMVSVSFSSSEKKARDAKRRGDIHALQNCMEQYYSAGNGYYQLPVNSNTTLICAPCETGASCLLGSCLPSSDKCVILKDPVNSSPNLYNVSKSTKTDYTISVPFESVVGTSATITNLQ